MSSQLPSLKSWLPWLLHGSVHQSSPQRTVLLWVAVALVVLGGPIGIVAVLLGVVAVVALRVGHGLAGTPFADGQAGDETPDPFNDQDRDPGTGRWDRG